MFLQTSLVTEEEFWRAYREMGAIYFIRDEQADQIKVGYTRDHSKRLSNLQVGSSRRLELIGLIAAEQAIEGIVHQQLTEGSSIGEWFWDRGITTQWLMDMTQDEPLYRNVWRLVPGRWEPSPPKQG